MKYLLAILAVSICLSSAAQQTCHLRLSGHVEDADTKEKLILATVRIPELNIQITTDAKGDFVFNGMCPGNYSLIITHVDCDSVRQQVSLAKDQHFDIFLPHARNTLSEVVVESRTISPATGFRQELSGRKLEETKGQSISEALGRINGVTLLQTGSTVSKPVIHGLHGNRILTINNGVRQEGQQWGNEHAPEIDAFIADKLTVIKGVDELKYGSDAIGGVILIQPRPLRTQPGYNAEVNLGYFTNNRQYVASAVLEQQLKRLPSFTYRVQGTFKKGANSATPGYRLNNTASTENNFSATAGWRTKAFSSELFYSLFTSEAGIFPGSHIGNISDLEAAIAAPRPDPVFTGEDSYRIGRPYQDVMHQLLKSKTQFTTNGHRFNVQLSGQLNNRKEFDIVRTAANTRPQLNLNISTFSEDVSWEHRPARFFTGTIGISAMQQDNAYAGRYFIPNYKAYTYGAYAIEKWSRHSWELQAGVRLDHKRVNTNRMLAGADSSFANNSFRYTTLASSANAAYRFSEKFKANVNLSLSGRAPQVNELLSNGIHHGTATYEEGDPQLRTEKAFNVAAGVNYQNAGRTVQAELSVYTNLISDFIYQQPIPDEPVLTIAGAFPLIRFMQTDARLTGLDASVSIRPAGNLDWTSRVSLLRARNRKLDDWLILMPADRASTELAYHFPKGKKIAESYLSVEFQHVLRQTRVPDDKNGRQDYKEAPAAYSLVGLNGSLEILLKKQPIIFSVGVRNLFDEAYRDYLNTMRYFTDETGRNVNIRIRIPIGSSKVRG